jgi:hypothetical protein
MRDAANAAILTDDPDRLFHWYADVVKSLRVNAKPYNLSLAFDMDTGVFAGETPRPLDPAGLRDDAVNREARNRIIVVPITYAGILHETLSALGKTKKALGESLRAMGTGVDDALADWLVDKESGNAGFPWTHVADVVLLRFDLETRRRVRVAILRQINDALFRWRRADGITPHVAFVTHSLGTFATAEAIDVGVAGSDGGLPDFLPSSFDIEAFFSLANVTRVLANRVDDPYGWAVRTREVQTPPGRPGVVRTYVDARHALDPIPAVFPFHPPSPWGAQLPFFYSHLDLDVIRAPNVHGYSHYLNDPTVHCPLFNLLNVGGRQISDLEYEKERKRYTDEPDPKACGAALEGLRVRLLEIKQGPLPGEFFGWIQLAFEMWSAIEKAHKACAEELKP